MPTVDQKITFAEKYVVNKEGVRFSVKGRDWIREQFWLPADGFKLWNTKKLDVCDECKSSIGEIVEHPLDNETRSKEHLETGCPGLEAEPIIVTILNLERQDGKTFSSMAYALSELYKNKKKSFAFIAASEEQAEKLYRENYKITIQNSKALSKRTRLLRTRFEVPSTGGLFEALTTAHKSATGGTRTHILIDEARDIEARVITALIPSVFAMHGIECPNGHIKLDSEQAIDAPLECSACGSRLVPWHGRIIITSSSGIIEDGERDWMIELMEELERNPHPHYHLFRSDKTLNPRKSKKIVSAIEDVFGKLPSTQHYIMAETGNKWTRKGEDVVTPVEVKTCMDHRLINIDTCSDPCFGFLDTSDIIDKTSLVIVADDTDRSTYPFEYVYTPYIEFWDPTKSKKGVIDEEDVYNTLLLVLNNFSGLREIPVDTRGRPWAISLVKRVHKEGGSRSRRVKSWNKIGDESRDGWSALEQRIKRRLIRMQNIPEITREFKGVKRKVDKTGKRQSEVIDRDRRKSHKDITEGLAVCCYLVAREQLRGRKMGLSDMPKGKPNISKMLKRTYTMKTEGLNVDGF